jgi:hypothetical protein
MITFEPWRSTLSGRRSHIIPGPVLGVLELLDERGDLLLVPLGEEGVDDGVDRERFLTRCAAQSAGISS